MPVKPNLECPQCGKGKATTIMEVDTFTYGVTTHTLGTGEKALPAPARLTVTVPVRVCSCGFRWTDYEAEDIKLNAITKYLKEGR